MANPTINMIMLGPSRVGKSSLLATMYREIRVLDTDFTLNPVGETEDLLDAAYEELSEILGEPKYTEVTKGKKGNEGFTEHEFEVGFENSHAFNLVFHDFRGGALMKNGDELKELQQRISLSHVIFNVLDSVALMECDKIRSDKLNGHSRIVTQLDKSMTDGEKYLIVFVLVKCEKYMKKAADRKELMARFEERHKAVLKLIDKKNKSSNKIASLVIPVKTLGCVEFAYLNDDGHFVFVRKGDEFKPEDVDQPLRYALSFALNHVDSNRGMLENVVNWFTGYGKRFTNAVNDFHKGRKKNYTTYGNSDLL